MSNDPRHAAGWFRRSRSLRIAAILLAAPVSSASIAQQAVLQQDVFSVVTGVSVRHDSNLFRAPDASAASDTVKSGYVGLRLDKPWSLQRLQIDFTRTAYRYDQFTNLSADTTAYRGNWAWTITPRITGTLGATRSEAPTPFEVSGGTQRNVSINEERFFSVDGQVYGGWHLLGRYFYSEQKSELRIDTQPDLHSDNFEAGVRYVATSNSSITVTRRRTEGDYISTAGIPIALSSVLNAFQEDTTEVAANWLITPISTISGRVGWVEHEELIAQRNYARPVADLSYNWTPTRKLTVVAAARRNVTSLRDATSSYYQTTAFSLGPVWRVTAKTAVRLQVEHVDAQYRGTGILPLAGPARKDSTDNVLIGLDWLPTRTLSVGATFQRQHRSSNTPGFEYEADVGSVNVALRF